MVAAALIASFNRSLDTAFPEGISVRGTFMPPRLLCATLALVCLATSAPAQTVVGPEGPAGRYNRLRDISVRPHNIIAPVSPDVLGTAAVGAGVTFYDARFRRVANADRDHPLVLQLAQELSGLT